MKSPNITQAQLAALVTFAAGQAVAWGWLDAGRAQLVVAIGSTAVAIAWKLADAIVRHGRGRYAAIRELGELTLELETSRTSSSSTSTPAAEGG